MSSKTFHRLFGQGFSVRVIHENIICCLNIGVGGWDEEVIHDGLEWVSIVIPAGYGNTNLVH